MAAWTADQKNAFRRQHPVKMPKRQNNHIVPRADVKEYFDFLFAADYGEYKGLVPVVARKTGSATPKTITMVPAEQLGDYAAQMHISNKLDYYFGKAQQPRPDCKWGKESAFAHNAIYADIDCHSDRTPAVSLKYVADLVFNTLPDHNIPIPNSAVFTGRGLHLVWAIDQVAGALGWMVTAVSVAFSDAVQTILTDHSISDYSVDLAYASNISGLSRLPGSRNTKSGSYSSVDIIHHHRLDLQKAYDSIRVNKASANISNRTINHSKSASNVPHTHRMHWLLDLTGNIDVGRRDIYLFMLYNCARMEGMTDAEAVELVYQANSGLSVPMPCKEILGYLMTARNIGGYRYSTRAIIDMLGLTGANQTASEHATKRNRNAARDQRTAAKRQTRDRKIMTWHLLGLSVSEIAAKGIVCYNTVRKIIAVWSGRLSDLFSRAELRNIARKRARSSIAHIKRSHRPKGFQNLKTHNIMLIVIRGTTLNCHNVEVYHTPPGAIIIGYGGGKHRWNN